MRPEFSALFRTRLDSSANSGESGSELRKGRIFTEINMFLFFPFTHLRLTLRPDNNSWGAEKVIECESSPINFND